jgi:hypothetical protein
MLVDDVVQNGYEVCAFTFFNNSCEVIGEEFLECFDTAAFKAHFGFQFRVVLYNWNDEYYIVLFRDGIAVEAHKEEKKNG